MRLKAFGCLSITAGESKLGTGGMTGLGPNAECPNHPLYQEQLTGGWQRF
jgi:hypothetical protein